MGPVYGLVLVGGTSRRMKAEKASLEYHGKPQVVYCAELLARHCDRVFVSSRSSQADLFSDLDIEHIHDAEEGLGPLGGILSALKAHADCPWCVLACDMPFVKDETLRFLLTNRNPLKLATAYASSVDGLPEPLCAIYEPGLRPALELSRRAGELSLRKVLSEVEVELLESPEDFALTNVNTWEAYEESLSLLKKRKGGDGG